MYPGCVPVERVLGNGLSPDSVYWCRSEGEMDMISLSSIINAIGFLEV